MTNRQVLITRLVLINESTLAHYVTLSQQRIAIEIPADYTR